MRHEWSPSTIRLVWGQRGEALQDGEHLAEDAVGEGEVVEVGAVAELGVVVVDAAPDVGAVRHREVEEDEVGLIGVQDLKGMLLQVEMGQVAMAHVEGAEIAVGAGGRLDLANDLTQRSDDIVGERGVMRH